MALRGVFTSRKAELEFQYIPWGAGALFPELFDDFVNYVAPEYSSDSHKDYYRLLTSDDKEAQRGAAHM